MALTRKLLKGMGLTDEQIDSVIDAHTETVGALKTQIETYKADADKLKDVQKKLDERNDGKDWKAEYDKLNQSFKDYRAEVAGKEALAAKQAAFRKLLSDESIPDKYHDRILKMTDFDSVELDGDKVKDEASQRDSIRKEWGDFKATTQTQGDKPETPPNNGKTALTMADIYKRDDRGRYVMSTEERQKALSENPDLMK